ncbi:alpha/beta fold hydrolase [Adhaeribacter soli]|uniref:Alpha/beta hydrolase n=1 Tax=Adhaeribacter soli TaxID=2607655 RepID=A0A5N1J4V1_9BACT|nr:alpha/beta hydrolase [Adhaeribacter soli]KAA9345724.1 alpha/beta hydrolase [Adhaeribacter soli]
MNVRKRNNISVNGKGKQPMLFAHGYGCDQNMWRFITPAFEDEYRIVLFDHVGFGESEADDYAAEKYNSLQAYADDVLEICEALELQDVVYVGHSVSAMIGMLAAIKRPGIFSQLVLVAPSPCYINYDGYRGGFSEAEITGMLEALDSDFFSWSSNIAPLIMGSSGLPELTDELTESFCRSNLAIAKNFARIMFLADNRRELTNVRTPSLILQCSEDAVAPLEVGEYMHRNMPASKLQLLAMNGHSPHLTAPQETITAIKAFLEKG